MVFNEKLISLRKQNNMSQEQLGAQIGVSRQTISKWELGDTTPEMEKLIQLSELFDISIDVLVGREVKDSCLNEGNEIHGNNSNRNVSFSPFYWHYEYKSKRTIKGIPLVHINIGRGLYHAKGLIAVGTFAKGLLSMGLFSVGILSFGVFSLGLLSLGALSLGFLLSLGALSLGTISFGGLAIGILSLGGCSIGVYSIGGGAFASKIALGGYAQAPIAIGDFTVGKITFDVKENIQKDDVYHAIITQYPNIKNFIVNLFCFVLE